MDLHAHSEASMRDFETLLRDLERKALLEESARKTRAGQYFRATNPNREFMVDLEAYFNDTKTDELSEVQRQSVKL